MDFVAIDFETANASPDSACALGLVTVRNSKIVERRYTLIDPCAPFDKHCTYIHNITAKRVAGMPTFADIYARLSAMLENQFVAAHNALFDFGVLKASCASRGLEIPQCSQFCTVEMAKKAWPNLAKHKLSALCEEFSLELNHHNAIEDATACAQLLLLCAKERKAQSVSELKARLEMK